MIFYGISELFFACLFLKNMTPLALNVLFTVIADGNLKYFELFFRVNKSEHFIVIVCNIQCRRFT